jgi:hypothetical protein
MIINSPVGRFPFQANSIGVRDGRVRLEGAMGTWPTSVEVQVSELPRVVGRLLPVGAIAKAVGAAAVVAIVARRRRRQM